MPNRNAPFRRFKYSFWISHCTSTSSTGSSAVWGMTRLDSATMPSIPTAPTSAGSLKSHDWRLQTQSPVGTIRVQAKIGGDFKSLILFAIFQATTSHQPSHHSRNARGWLQDPKQYKDSRAFVFRLSPVYATVAVVLRCGVSKYVRWAGHWREIIW